MGKSKKRIKKLIVSTAVVCLTYALLPKKEKQKIKMVTNKFLQKAENVVQEVQKVYSGQDEQSMLKDQQTQTLRQWEYL